MNAQQERVQKLRVAAFVVVTLSVVIGCVLVLGHSRSLFARKATLHTTFANTAGLITGASVRLAGVDVGIVKAIRFDPAVATRRIDVDLTVGSKDLERIRGDSVAQIDSKGLLGDMIIDITLGSEDKPPLKDGDHLDSVEASGFAQVIATVEVAIKKVDVLVTDVDSRVQAVLTPAVATDLGRIVHSAAAVMEGVEHGNGLAHALIYKPALADSTGEIIRDFERIAGRVDDSITQLQTMMTDARTGDGLIHALVYDPKGGLVVGDLQKVASNLSDIVAEVKVGHGLVHSLVYEEDKTNLMQNLSEAAKVFRRLADEVDQGKGTIGGLLKDPTAYEDLTTIFGNLKRNALLKALVRYTIVKDELRRPVVGPPKDVSGPPKEVAGGTR